jgi:hypothetical protein
MGWFDTVVRDICHEISGIGAVQYTQLNVAVVVLALLGIPVLAGTVARPTPPDPLLDGGDTVPCAAQPDYAAATDATGRPVVPADVRSRPVPVPDSLAVPLKSGRHARRGEPGQDSSYAAISGDKIAPLVNPRPCR